MRLFFLLINTIGLLTSLATVLGFATPLFWGFRFLEHPRPQYSLCLLIILLIYLSSHRYPAEFWPPAFWPWIILIPLLINLVLLWPYYPRFGHQPAAPADRLRILHSTLNHRNPESARKTLDWLDRQEVDLAFILEFPTGTLDALRQLNHYELITANTTAANSNDPLLTNHMQALLIRKQSPRIQVLSTDVLHLPADNRRPLLSAKILFQNRPLTFLDFHSVRPSHGNAIAFQTLEFDAIADWSNQQLQDGQAIVMLGDWNDTPWSMSYRQTLAKSGLLDTMFGRGIQGSWSADWPKFLRIPIDQAWHSSQLKVSDRYLGPHFGSDHLPLRIDLAWKR
jgi:endonuclease/exonuclease/phosphatase (EEP) superfamily protein YafD